LATFLFRLLWVGHVQEQLHLGFRLVQKAVTSLNHLELPNGHYFASFHLRW